MISTDGDPARMALAAQIIGREIWPGDGRDRTPPAAPERAADALQSAGLLAGVPFARVVAERDAIVDALADALGMEDGADHWSQLTAQAAATKASEEEASDELKRLRPVIEAARAWVSGIRLVSQDGAEKRVNDERRSKNRQALQDAVDALGEER